MTQKQQNQTRTPPNQRGREDAIKARKSQPPQSEEVRQPRADAKKQEEMDDAIEDSFPASDPPAHSSATTLGPSTSKDPRDNRNDRKHRSIGQNEAPSRGFLLAAATLPTNRQWP